VGGGIFHLAPPYIIDKLTILAKLLLFRLSSFNRKPSTAIIEKCADVTLASGNPALVDLRASYLCPKSRPITFFHLLSPPYKAHALEEEKEGDDEVSTLADNFPP
jgi:hypothetical protein